MNTDTRHTHVDTEELVRLADGELAGAQLRAVEQALTECDVCRSNARGVRLRTARLSQALAHADWQPPAPADSLARLQAALATERQAARVATPLASRSSRQFMNAPARLRLAAGIAVLLLGAALVATPAAAWIAGFVTSAWHAVTGSTPDPAAPRPDSPADVAAQWAYDYVPEAGVLTVHLTGDPTGVLRLEAAAGARLVLTAAATAAPDVLLLTGQVTIHAADGVFHIAVPDQVDAVRVRRGERTVVTFTRQQFGSGAGVELRLDAAPAQGGGGT